MRIKFVKVRPRARTPRADDIGDAGSKVYACISLEGILLPPGHSKWVRTGLAIEVPAEWNLQIVGTQELSDKNVFVQSNVLLDSSFRGELSVCLFNNSTLAHLFKHEDVIAKLVPVRVEHPTWQREDYITQLYEKVKCGPVPKEKRK